MKKLKFTPGPWKVTVRYFPSVVLAPEKDDMGRGSIVVNISHDQEVESIMANAKLISKAPEMYYALLKAKESFGYIKELLAPLKASQDEPENIAFHEAYKALSEINKILEQ